MALNDESIKKLVSCKSGRYIYSSTKFHNLSNEAKEYIYNRFNDGVHYRYRDNEKYEDILKCNLVRILKNLYELPTCKYCGKIIKSINQRTNSFMQYCSIGCERKSLEYNWKTDLSLRAIKGMDSYKKRTGYDCIFKNPTVKNNIYKWNHSIQNKNNWKRIANDPKVREKSNNTKRRNNTFNTSKIEDELYLYIKEKFPEVKRQYKDKERYPFLCDFYIPSLDYFIELQGHWTHNDHPYDKDSMEDQKKVKEWKSKHTRYYDNAIRCWTISDVKKRETARNNNINYKEIWSLNEGKNFVDSLK